MKTDNRFEPLSFNHFNFHSVFTKCRAHKWNTKYFSTCACWTEIVYVNMLLIKVLILFSMKELKFSHDVTKIQPTKLSILPRFYFHDVLQQLKTNFHTNFRFKRVLGFVIEYAWISKFSRDAAFTWRPRELSCRLKKITYFKKFCYPNSSCIINVSL